VVAADVYALQGEEGRGGWTWYTGSSGWMYRVWLEEVIGFRLRGQTVMIDPVIPPDWKHFSVSYRYEETSYEMTVENPDAISRVFDRTDGARISTHFMQDDKEDTVRIRLVVTASQHKRR
jgi:cyclic beta-1,2-glucan synthetase